MSDFLLEVQEAGQTRREPLSPGLTRVGGSGCEVVLARAGADQLHVWDAPPRLVFVGKGDRPRVDGRSVDEIALVGNERIEWLGVTLRLRARSDEPVLREIPLPAGSVMKDARAWARVRAGLLTELGLVERGAAKRWQEAVLRGEFDADACARDLDAASQPAPDDPRLLERSGRLLRDLLMAPYQRGLRGAGRRARGAARSGLAFLLTQLIVLLVFTVLIGVVLLVVRLRWGWSLDGLLDRVIELVPS